MKWKWIGGAAAGAVALLFCAGLTCVYIAKSDWLRNKVRELVLQQAEKTTGGKVEISKFLFDWKTLTAEFDGFVIHGTEPVRSPPLLSVEKVIVRLKVVSLMKNDFDIASARVEMPRVYLLVALDGSTNVPRPKIPVKRGKTPVETILDLKVAEFTLVNGSAEVHAAGQAPKVMGYEASGKALQTRFNYDAAGRKYAGTLSIKPLDLRYGDYQPVQLSADLALVIEQSRLTVSSAKLDLPESHVQLSGAVESFASPVITVKYNGNLSVRELGNILNLKLRQSGTVRAEGEARYVSATDYQVHGDLHARQIAFAQNGVNLRDARLDSSFNADPRAIALNGFKLSALGGQVNGRVEIQDLDRFSVSATLAKFDVATLTAFVTDYKLPYDGAVNGPFQMKGRLSDKKYQHLEASGKLAISPAGTGLPVLGLVDASYRGATSEVALAPSFLTLPHTRVNVSGVLGETLQMTAESTDLDDLRPLTAKKLIPLSLQQGSVQFAGTVTGKLDSPQILGHVTGRNFVYSGERIESLSADITASEDRATVRGGSLTYKGLLAGLQGSLGLVKWKATDASQLSANATLQNASVTNLLLLAGRKDVPVTGVLNAAVQVAGTVGNPQATANLTIVNGSAYEEPFDRATGKVEYSNEGSQVGTFQFRAGSKQADLTVRYQHAPNLLETGQLHFQVSTNRMAIAQFVNARKYQPGLSGTATVTANGDVSFTKGTPKITTLDSDANATGLVLNSRQLGDVKLTARTKGQTLTTQFTSNLAGADIRGEGNWQIAGDYLGVAQVSFAKLDLGTARKLLALSNASQSFVFLGSTEGKATVSGPLLKPEQLTAALEIPRLEIKPEPISGLNKELSDLTIRNTEPIRMSLIKSVVSVESARFTAANTDVSLVGTISLKEKNAFNLNMNGNVNLKLARTFSADLDSSGSLLVRVTLRGPLDKPQLGGTADLRGGNISIAGVPNGLSNATGRIAFNENRATIETLTAQTGGGTIKLDGFAAFGGPFTSFRLGAVATGVRVRYPEGISSVSDANLAWTGTTERSLLSGDVTVHKVSYNPQSDLGSVLSLTSGPTPTASSPTGVLGGTQFDVRVQTASDVSFQTGLLTGLQTEANLRLRGKAANPALLGRIVIYSGTLTFFGNKYVINEGTISFFNPVKIEPIFNVDLETQARGVDVTLTVTGPLTKLGVTYRSDPPLQFFRYCGPACYR